MIRWHENNGLDSTFVSRLTLVMFGGAIEEGRIVFPAVAAINAKEAPEIDHEHNRDNPISKKHGHLM